MADRYLIDNHSTSLIVYIIVISMNRFFRMLYLYNSFYHSVETHNWTDQDDEQDKEVLLFVFMHDLKLLQITYITLDLDIISIEFVAFYLLLMLICNW